MRCIRKNLRKTGRGVSVSWICQYLTPFIKVWTPSIASLHPSPWFLPLPSPSPSPSPSPPPSHVVCHVVLLPSVLVKAVRNVLQFLLLQTTDEAACLQASQRKRGEKRGRSNSRTYTLDGASHTCMSSFKASSLFLSLPNESVIRPLCKGSRE